MGNRFLMHAGQDASKAPAQSQHSVLLPSSQPSRLDQMMNSASTTIGFGPSKQNVVPLATRDGPQLANGLSQKAQVSDAKGLPSTVDPKFQSVECSTSIGK